MRHLSVKRVLGSCSIIAFLVGCGHQNVEPEYSIVPHIDLLEFKFSQGDISLSKPDTLKMKFYLTDGDLDLGLGVADTLPPFNHAFVYNKRSGEFVPANSVPKDLTDLITYRDCKTLDTLPPLTCGNWALAYRSGSVIDTVYYKVNSNHWNLFINLYAKDVAGAWQPISTANLAPFQACTPGLFNATFPRLPFVTSGPFKYQSTSSRTGTMTYDVTSFGITSLLGGKTVKIQFHIQDRALHVSNYVAKDDIVIH